mmetsp:Transcript_23460/g.54503  ORF Transcript_23460/g.54503 Transcript_23460/m.54503 type:complete len:189 (-) Transcript_23460:931-1497(-)
MLVAAARRQAHPHRCVSGGRTLIASVDAALVRPVRKTVSLEERAILRAARKKRATQTLQREQGGDTSTSTTTASPSFWATNSRWIWYLGVFVPSGLFAWAINDENSPPAKISRMIGLTKFITGFTDEISKPPHEKLLPDWDQVRSSSLIVCTHPCFVVAWLTFSSPTRKRIRRCPMFLMIFQSLTPWY